MSAGLRPLTILVVALTLSGCGYRPLKAPCSAEKSGMPIAYSALQAAPASVYAFLAFYVSLIQQSIDALNGVASSRTASWATIGPVVLLAIVGVLLLSQLNNVAAAIAGGVPISAARIEAILATVTGFKLGMAANSARLALAIP